MEAEDQSNGVGLPKCSTSWHQETISHRTSLATQGTEEAPLPVWCSPVVAWLCSISLPTVGPTGVGRRSPWDPERIWFSLSVSRPLGAGRGFRTVSWSLNREYPQGCVGTPPQLPGKQSASPSPSSPGSLRGYQLDQVGGPKKKYPAGS